MSMQRTPTSKILTSQNIYSKKFDFKKKKRRTTKTDDAVFCSCGESKTM